MNTRTIRTVCGIALTGAVAVTTPAADTGRDAAAPARRRQTTCPVMGGAINPKLHVDVNGKRVYVCCRGCIEAVKRDPATYIRKLEDDGVTLEPAPVTADATD